MRCIITAALFLVSTASFAQVPTYQIRVDVLDSMIFEVKRGRSCDSLQKAQLVVIEKQAQELLAGYEIIRLEQSQVKSMQAINASWESTVTAMNTKHEAEKGILKAKIRKLWRVIVAEGSVILIILLL